MNLNLFFRYVSASVAGMIALSCYILADTYFVSAGMGADGLTALNLAIPIYSFIHGSGLMIGIGAATRFTMQKSRGQDREADAYFTHALLSAGVFALVCVAGSFGAEQIVRIFGAQGRVAQYSADYLRVIMSFGPAFLLNNVLLGFVRNDGAPRLAMSAMIIGSLSNVVLDWVMIFPCGMGIVGAAVATGLAPIISVLILSPHVLRSRCGFHVIRCPLSWRKAVTLLSAGVPSLVSEVSSGVVMIVFNFLLLHLGGNTAVAAYGVIANLSLVVISIYTGIAQGIQPLLTRACAAGRNKEARLVLRAALICMLVFSALVFALTQLGTDGIVGVFNSARDPQLQQTADAGMRLYFLAVPFAGFNIILSMYFTSAARLREAHVISLLRGFVLIIPTTFLLAAVLGITGVWCAFPLTEALCALLALAFWAYAGKQRLAAVSA